MFFSQVEHLIKMINNLLSKVTWFTTLCIYLLFIHPPIYLTNYLLSYYPPTHLPINYLPMGISTLNPPKIVITSTITFCNFFLVMCEHHILDYFCLF
jgi:hypothetical protein